MTITVNYVSQVTRRRRRWTGVFVSPNNNTVTTDG
jgi:hypothetical protein